MADYSPRLKKAMAEIKQILKAYDIAAVVVLHTAKPEGEGVQGNSEFLFSIDPSYSCASTSNGELLIQMKKEHFIDDRERHFRVSATKNMFESLADVTSLMAQYSIQADKMMQTVVETEAGHPPKITHDEKDKGRHGKSTTVDLVDELKKRDGDRYKELIENAVQGVYHDYQSEEVAPKMRLVEDLAPFPELADIRKAVINGDYDEPLY